MAGRFLAGSLHAAASRNQQDAGETAQQSLMHLFHGVIQLFAKFIRQLFYTAQG